MPRLDHSLTVAVLAASICIAAFGLRRRKASGVVADGIDQCIGNTPLVKVHSLSKATGCEVYAKLELANPGGSAKDRVALAIIRKNEKDGVIKPGRGDTIFEGTSGSTGISFAMLCNSLGYKAHICLPSDTSQEKLQLLESFGAIIEKVKPASIVDPNQYVNAARRGAEVMSRDPSSTSVGVFADQFENDSNWRIHYATTGPEIWNQLQGKLDYFITGSGTGGTIAGCARFFKEQKRQVKVFLADPQGSGLYNRIKHGVMFDTVEKEGTRRRHQVDTVIEGIGLNRVTHNFHMGEALIDDSVRVLDEEAMKMASYLCRNDGLFLGSSSCINAVGVLKLIKEGMIPAGSTVCFIACDSGNRHLSKFWLEARLYKDIELDDIITSTVHKL
ncbi:BA75_01577T0 [Komagataella pastoris]|uniref:BA75_01577T0 n=1 Tax=Komagataella pastoris TaxID=4922 RepID=A0A1B2J8L1_PICPA|nr:BA75_01577T0 [Komagataella pastoris]